MLFKLESLIYHLDGPIDVGLLDGSGFSLPIATAVEVVDVQIEVSDSARKAVLSAIGEQTDTHVLIISAKAGGCSGYLYDMVIVEKPDSDGFQTVDIDGVTVMIHNKDSALLNGLRLDFRDSLMGGGFHMDNPNADRACGCGQSFG
jgi:iron-sulfur cluster assembly protein